jgi:hypothetical protein
MAFSIVGPMEFWADIHFIVLLKPRGSAGLQGTAVMFTVYARPRAIFAAKAPEHYTESFAVCLVSGARCFFTY